MHLTVAVELRRHTDNDGDVLTPAGVAAALRIGRRMRGPYHRLISSGAQRATQTMACFLSAMPFALECGVTVDPGFGTDLEDRWRAAAPRARSGDMEGFRIADGQLVDTESQRLGEALLALLDSLSEGQQALVVGHSPLIEAAVYALTGMVPAPLPKGEGILVEREGTQILTSRLGA